MEKLPWPSKGDLLITSGDDWWHNACVNWSWDLFHTYATGYKLAAEKLFEYVATQKSDQDVLVYPIFFLWRHHVELMLKGLIMSARRLKGEQAKFPQVHSVFALWKEFRPLLESIEPNGSREDLRNVENIIKQLREIDENSLAFRYPVTQEGALTLPSEIRHINLRNLNEVMVGLATFLGAVDSMLDYYQEVKEEFDTDLSEDIGDES